MKAITIHNLKESTEQEVFDFVANHLLTQMEQSRDNENQCAYRGIGEKGMITCAAGCLIPNRDYHLRMEKKSWTKLVIYGIVPEEHSLLITDLQNLHDGFDPSQWKNELIQFARDNNLSEEFVQNFKLA